MTIARHVRKQAKSKAAMRSGNSEHQKGIKSSSAELSALFKMKLIEKRSVLLSHFHDKKLSRISLFDRMNFQTVVFFQKKRFQKRASSNLRQQQWE